MTIIPFTDEENLSSKYIFNSLVDAIKWAKDTLPLYKDIETFKFETKLRIIDSGEDIIIKFEWPMFNPEIIDVYRTCAIPNKT